MKRTRLPVVIVSAFALSITGMSTAAAHGGGHDSDLGLRDLGSEAEAEDDDRTPDYVKVTAEYRCDEDDGDADLYVYLKQWTDDDGKAFYDDSRDVECTDEWEDITVTLERDEAESDEDAYAENGHAYVFWELEQDGDEVTEDRTVDVEGVDEDDDDHDYRDGDGHHHYYYNP